MSRKRNPSDLLQTMAEAFPHTFFADPKQVQPLKVDIHLDLLAALPEGIKPSQAQRFLSWYVACSAYLESLLQGKGRIDLTGAVVESEIPDFIREQARERFLKLGAARQSAKTANRTGNHPAAQPGQPRPAAPATEINLKDLYAMAVDAKLEITLKFSTLPNAKPAGSGKMAFALKTPDGQFVTVEVNNKTWNKLVKAAEEWPSWVAALSGTMGPRTEKGFALAGPGLQVFEKKAKTAETTSPPVDAPSVPASLAELVAPPPPAPPVTVSIQAGTATVTKRAPLSLKR